MNENIIFINGDILTKDFNILIHQVNCMGAFGCGMAGQIKRQYPIVEQKYKAYCKTQIKTDLKGKVQPVKIGENKYIYNMFSQFAYGKEKKRYTSYSLMEKAFHKINLRVSKDFKIYIPYNIGCGNAGGDWEIVLKIIKQEFSDRQIYICKKQ
jgi:O-acetyl-ADP-ribose deacetylase (regulator of RNase III)